MHIVLYALFPRRVISCRTARYMTRLYRQASWHQWKSETGWSSARGFSITHPDAYSLSSPNNNGGTSCRNVLFNCWKEGWVQNLESGQEIFPTTFPGFGYSFLGEKNQRHSWWQMTMREREVGAHRTEYITGSVEPYWWVFAHPREI